MFEGGLRGTTGFSHAGTPHEAEGVLGPGAPARVAGQQAGNETEELRTEEKKHVEAGQHQVP